VVCNGSSACDSLIESVPALRRRLMDRNGSTPASASLAGSWRRAAARSVPPLAVPPGAELSSGRLALDRGHRLELRLDVAQHAGCATAEEACGWRGSAEELARLVGQEDNNFVKVEVDPRRAHCSRSLRPRSRRRAACAEGFTVLPYINAIRFWPNA